MRIAVERDDDGSLWATVAELPGVFTSGQTVDEIVDALAEAIDMCVGA